MDNEAPYFVDMVSGQVAEAFPGVTAQTYVFRSRKGGNRPISSVQAWRILREACEAGIVLAGISAGAIMPL